ncbi:MAG: hypothetical protein ACT4OO_05775 [Nitrospiraceae bacterium]
MKIVESHTVFSFHLVKSLSCGVALAGLLLSGCGGIQETWEGPAAKSFHPRAIAILPPMASQYDGAREDVQDVLAASLAKIGKFERVVSPDQATEVFQGSKEAFDALVFYFSRLETTGHSDKDLATKLGKAMNADALLVVRINAWEYVRKEGDNLGRVGLGLRLVDASNGAVVWKARHEKARSYIFFRPNLKEIAVELSDEMIKYMPR